MEAVIKQSVTTINSANVSGERKSDWDEIRDVLHPAAQKCGLTFKRSQELLKQARTIINDCGN